MLRIVGLDEVHYDYIVSRLDEWWGGRAMAAMLPRLWFKEFNKLGFVAMDENEVPAGFVVGFVSPRDQAEAYVHFIGVDPQYRGMKTGRSLYYKFFDAVRELGCTHIHAVTSPTNKTSLRFHETMGFMAVDPDAFDVLPTRAKGYRDYDGPGEDRVVLKKIL